ncbi:MAG TPA: hypothetical protein DCE41_17970 [Cytophagales bacterium]|nr:hypothetical protein [Cytophagales bacterium]HAA23639.1 hypothetical protein [Cytophagales bacterium]HAP65362.1 hypothetical protein [Cytophagales bacterium]
MDDVISLLENYRDFQQSVPQGDFAEFGDWLKQKHTSPSAYATDQESVNLEGPAVMAGYLLGGLSSFVETWVKLSFQEIPLGSLQDYGIMKSVEYSGNPTKKQLAEEIIAERTTVIESIKRLTKEGLLWETPDDQDRRLRRVMLTDKGAELIAIADKKMVALGNLLMGPLTEPEQKSMMPALNRLMDFHQHLYYQQTREKVKEDYSL